LQDETVVVVSFDMKIGDLVDTEIMQVLSIDTAKKEAALMWGTLMESPEDGSAPPEEAAPEVEDTWLSKDLWPGEAAGRGMVEAEIPREISDIPGGPWMVPEPEAPPPRENQRRPQASDYVFSGLSQVEQRKLELLLEVPLKVSVILGRTRRPIKEVLNLTPGAIVELHSLVDDPVEVLVNGTLVAKGEVVVVNENFGVRITYIVSPEERLRQLRE
jgi:flagellar motor switch protein FliN/FliY